MIGDGTPSPVSAARPFHAYLFKGRGGNLQHHGLDDDLARGEIHVFLQCRKHAAELGGIILVMKHDQFVGWIGFCLGKFIFGLGNGLEIGRPGQCQHDR